MRQIPQAKTIKIFLFAFLLFAAGTTNAQVGIGTPTPNASAQLDVNSTSKGFLPPRMTQAQRNAVIKPAPGLMIWCTDCNTAGEIQVFNGLTWTNSSGGYPAVPIPTSVKIGTQTWMTRNLDVVTYRNGDTIPEVTDPTRWANLKDTGAWCYYNNDPANGAIYGKLYNHAAVVDPRGLAPVGWHIPNDHYDENIEYLYDGGGEWRILWEYLGGKVNIAYDPYFAGVDVEADAGKMRATPLWERPNTGITNETGFTALPGGQRNEDGSFSSIGKIARWWSAGIVQHTKIRTGTAYSVSEYYISTILDANHLDFKNEILFHFYGDNPVDGNFDYRYYPQNGFSVRCVKD